MRFKKLPASRDEDFESVGQALLRSEQSGDDYEFQNVQRRVQAFLESARCRTRDYFEMTHAAQWYGMSGGHMRAALEQALNSGDPEN